MAEVELTAQVVGGRYKVLDKLGEGAMGAVYLANDQQLPRQVALKVLRKEWVSRPDVKRRLENECGLMARLGPNTHIVTLYDRLEYDGSVVLVMEYVPGETLADICDRTRTLNSDDASSRKTTPVAAGTSVMALDEHDAVGVICQCLEGLGFAHSKGIVHRDIKPSNIMVMRDHNGDLAAKIMDFGIGKALSGGEDAFTSPMLTAVGGPGPGTPAYMAPEQIDPKRFGSVTPASDLYAIGVTFYELLTLARPFEGTYTELLHAHTSVEPPDPRKIKTSVSPDLAAVVLKALRKNPTERYQSAAEFKYDLEAAKAASPNQSEDPIPKRNWLPVLLAGIAGLLVVIAGSVYLFSSSGNEIKKTVPVPSPPAQPIVPVVPPPVPVSPPLSPPKELSLSISPSFRDVKEGESFSVKVAVEGAADPAKVVLTAVASDDQAAAFNPQTGEFRWTGRKGLFGPKSVTFTAVDSSASSPRTIQQPQNFTVQPDPEEDAKRQAERAKAEQDRQAQAERDKQAQAERDRQAKVEREKAERAKAEQDRQAQAEREKAAREKAAKDKQRTPIPTPDNDWLKDVKASGSTEIKK